MTSTALLERLQRALLPEYRVERELASGGMGVVFLAQDLALDRPVAIKVLRPELATALLVERFVSEARLLARLRHPNVVPVHDVGDADGLSYFVMDLVDGETLAHRLARGRLTPGETLKLGRDLLDGLEAAHQLGFIHRDVKPGNVFLVGSRAVLADFGIAQAVATGPPEGPILAGPVGTPGYMPPEQAGGGEVTTRSDVYAVGAVLYEALTGRGWTRTGRADWNGVPRTVAGTLRRALAPEPRDRWPDARSFRRALWQVRARRHVQRAAWLTAGGLVAGAIGALGLVRIWPLAASAGSVSVIVPEFAYTGPPASRWISDSLVNLVRSALGGHADFRVAESRGFLPTMSPSQVVEVRVEVVGGEVRGQVAGEAREFHVPIERWRALADSLTYGALLTIWDARSPLAASLPLRVLPQTPVGLSRFLEAERLVAAALWGEAYRAYTLAEATDSTCLLCSWRVNEIERWLALEHDPARVRRFLGHVDSFPPWYQSLIRAGQMPLRERLDTLRRLTERSPAFFLGWFQLGDELFHRGPLVGHQRSEAITPFETSVRLSPDFAPGWEHLAWVFTAEGDSGGAARSLAALDRRGPVRDPFSGVLRSLLELGFAWRFLPGDQAARMTEGVLTSPAARDYPDAGAGPRLLPAFDAPRGALGFGQMMMGAASPDLKRSGLIAQVLGAVAVGQISRAQEAAQRLVAVSPAPEITLFVTELDVALSVTDNVQGVDPRVLERLQRFVTPGAGSERLRSRAAWMSAVARSRVDSLASADVDSTARQLDPFFRTVARLEGARRRAEAGDIEGARQDLHWYQHDDLVALPTGLPQAAEVDWAFGTLARWRLARLLDGGPDHAEACRAYQGVVRHWSGGDPPYAARADSARSRVLQLKCTEVGQ